MLTLYFFYPMRDSEEITQKRYLARMESEGA